MPISDVNAKREYDREYARRSDVRARRSEYNKAWREKNKDRRKISEEERKMRCRAQILVTNCLKRVRKRGLCFDLHDHVEELQSRIDAGFCELTGYLFNLAGGRTFDSPSLDRIDASRGYTIDNVRIVLHCVNAALGDWGESNLRDVMEAWLR